jgi:hypothetical protein
MTTVLSSEPGGGIQRGDTQAAQGIKQINRRRVVYGLKTIQT